MCETNFPSQFKELTGNKPFPWQERLFCKFLKAEFPQICSIPTGLGKTSVIALWAIALASLKGQQNIPRRLVYVVNRRTIVDQSSSEVEKNIQKLDDALNDEKSPLHTIALKLQKLSSGNMPGEKPSVMNASTLRGELADNKLRKFDPAAPSVIIGTVDMVGSKLLFSGYGDSQWMRPVYAGLLGADCLFIHDEAHLTPAFGRLLRKVQEYSTKNAKFIPPFRVMELSATQINTKAKKNLDDKQCAEVFGLNEEDNKNPIANKRINACKRLILHETNNKELINSIVEKAFSFHEKCQRIVIFVQKPDNANKIFEGIQKKIKERKENEIKSSTEPKITAEKRNQIKLCVENTVFILTGRIRGYERDKLLEKPGMKSFLGPPKEGQSKELNSSVYFVSTSAGEVGMDLNADQMVCDLSTMPSMIQRLGRLNRFGESINSKMHVYYSSNPEKDTALQFLRSKQENEEGIDAGINAVENWQKEDDYPLADAIEMVPLEERTLDLWSMTSIKSLHSKPDIKFWLHGMAENEPPDTYLAWRSEANDLAQHVEDKDIEKWFKRHPLLQGEKLRIPTDELVKEIQGKEFSKNLLDNQRIIIIESDNSIHVTSKINQEKNLRKLLNYATVILPLEAGALNSNGFFESNKLFKESQQNQNAKYDVSNELAPNIVKGILDYHDDNWIFRPYSEDPEITLDASDVKKGIQELKKHYESQYQPVYFNLSGESTEEDSEENKWLVFINAKEMEKPLKSNEVQPEIKDHHERIKEVIESIVCKIVCKTDLPDCIKNALILSAEHHDEGKANPIWQESINNKNTDKPLAKGPVDWRKLHGYRHETESLLKAEEDETIKNNSRKDLIQHLISSHHGRARPFFEPRAFDASDNVAQKTNYECMMRFEKLQREMGWWGLAWLEAILRRADGIASKGTEDA